MINVRDLGAVGDGATDDTAAFNAALSQGTHVYIPSGRYIINSPLQTLDYTNSQSAEGDNNRVTISGDGLANTTIEYRGDWACFKAVGGTAGTGNFTGLCIRDLQLSGGGESNSRGIYAALSPYLCLERVYIRGFGIGLETYNCDFVQIDKCLIRHNSAGIYSAPWYPNPPTGYETRPNNWSIRDTSISINSRYGIWLIDGSSALIDGCDIANNGMSTSGERWGIRFNGGCPEGGGHTVSNSYIESNCGVADIWYQSMAAGEVYAGVHNLRGNSFNRSTAFGYDHAKCNVLVQFLAGAEQKLVATGNSFKCYSVYLSEPPHGNYTILFDATNGCEPALGTNFVAFANHQQIAPGDYGFSDRF